MGESTHFESISDRRSLFLVNTFVIHTVRLLKDFSVICEDKLAEVHRRIVHADATISLLEAKLRNLDRLDGVGENTSQHNQPDLACLPGTPESLEPQHSYQSSMTLPISSGQSELNAAHQLPAINNFDISKVKDDTKFTRFFRMLQVGVPLQAVKIQMTLEGLDGSVLDRPEATVE